MEPLQGEALFEKQLRSQALFSSYFFVKVVLGYGDLSPTFHQPEMDLFLQNLEEGNRAQLIEWSRGHFKTTCFTIGTSIWFVLPVRKEDADGWKYLPEEWGVDEEAWNRRMALHNQDLAQLLAFESTPNASIKVSEIKWHFEENMLFRVMFPEIAYQGIESPWNSMDLKIRRTPAGGKTGESTFSALGVGTALQSQHYDIVWADDLVGKDAVESDTIMNKTIRWFGLLRGALRGAALKEKSIEIVVSNRWALFDLNAKLAKQPRFKVHTRRLYEKGPDGETRIAFPERFTKELIEEIQADTTLSRYDFLCQYMNSPIAEGATAITPDRLHKYKVDPVTGYLTCSCGISSPISSMARYLHYDPYNAKKLTSKSTPAIVIVGCLGGETEHVFLLDYYSAKQDYQKIFEKIIEYNDLYQPTMITFEDVGNQNMAAFHLTQISQTEDFRKAKHRAMPMIVPSQTKNKPKEVRIRDYLLPYVEQQKFSIRYSHREIEDMLTVFPQQMEGHDYDVLDALAQGPEHWSFPITKDEEDRMEELVRLAAAEACQSYSHV